MRWPFQAWGATAVLAGHAHVYERLVLDDNFPYFVNGSGGGGLHPFGPPVAGSQVRYNDLYGAMRITASPKSITFQFVALTGSVIDTHTIIQASLSPTTTTLSSSANPATAAIDVTFTATVAGKSPTGFVSFTEGRTAIGGCAAVALSGTGDSRTAACTTSALLIGTHGIVADYKGNIANAASFSTPLSQVITDPPQ